jgi:hypothetical protein
LLRKHGDVWIISTTHNPCKLVDIWNSGELTRENVSQLCVFEGQKSKLMINPDEMDSDSGFTFVLGATETGQVLIFENDGFIGSRTQVCDKELTERFMRMLSLTFFRMCRTKSLLPLELMG